MKRKILLIVVSILLTINIIPLYACTSVIISGRITKDGRPVMLKHRDTDEMDNRVKYFKGPKYTFIALVNSHTKGGEVWTGTNSAGFSIMNTASYNIKDDNVPDDQMDQEGVVMYKALGKCASTSDFESLLDTLPKPLGVEANFGIIDAQGNAAYYEVNNYSWKKYDVNDPNVAPNGYRVVTNFCESGRAEDRKGIERYYTACDIFKELISSKGKTDIGHDDLFNYVSRSYRHSLLGVDYVKNYDGMIKSGYFNGTAVDQDFIPRKITTASIVIEGVSKGENPLHTIMWTILGYPACSVAIPLFVGDGDHIPSYMKKSSSSKHSQICDYALQIKSKYVFTRSVSNGSKYVDLAAIIKGENGRPSLISCCKKTEKSIDNEFNALYYQWVKGIITDNDFYTRYDNMNSDFLKDYLSNFSNFIQ